MNRKFRNFIGRMQFEKTNAYEAQLLMMGEELLTTKMLLWDTEKFPFIPNNWDEYGFKVFSQNNEDGLIQYLIRHTDLPNKTFIEFGVENYKESNTRFLLLHNNWSGLVMDGSKEWMADLKEEGLYWKRDLEAKGAFITRENIEELIDSRGFDRKVGILSVDIDGNDYWILDKINCIDPQILICEYNPIFGRYEKVSIPYKSDFYRTEAHYSNLYWGASLGAFVYIAKKKGYKLVCLNNLGNNAFFVKEDACDLPEVSIDVAWREAKYRESRDESGKLTFLPLDKGRELINDMVVVDVVSGENKKIGTLKN